MKEYLDSVIVLALDLAALGVVYVLYKRRCYILEATKDAPSLEVNSELLAKVRQADQGTIPYAIVRGVVRAMEAPLRSTHIPDVSGVIREHVIKECKVRWSHASRLWFDETPEIHRSLNYIAFKLTGGQIFARGNVEITEPALASELPLQPVYDCFTPSEATFGGQITGWLRGEHIKGIHEIESMLLEGNEITAVGELSIVNNKLILKPPDELPYVLTYLSKDEIISNYNQEARSLRTWSVLLGCTGVGIALWIFNKWNAKRKIQKQKDEMMKIRAARRRQIESRDDSANPGNESIPQCVVCASNPVEITVLECGHACLCADCAENIQDNCPVCRGYIQRKVLIYLP